MLQGENCTESNRVWNSWLYTLEKTKLNAVCTCVRMELISPVVIKFGGISCFHFQHKCDNRSSMHIRIACTILLSYELAHPRQPHC
jgi:hypothetical protein